MQFRAFAIFALLAVAPLADAARIPVHAEKLSLLAKRPDGAEDSAHLIKAGHSNIPVDIKTVAESEKANYPLCGVCVQFAVAGLNYLLNAILNAGVIGGCSELCAYVPGKMEEKVCNVLCDAAGLAGFIEAIKKADLDFIYMCELVDKTGVNICPIQDCPKDTPDCLVPGELAVSPAKIKAGDALTAVLPIHATAATGTSMVRLNLCNEGHCNADDQLQVGWPAGDYSVQLNLNTTGMMPGAYVFSIDICEGTCNSDKPHSHNFGARNATFLVEGKEDVEETTFASVRDHFAAWMKVHNKWYESREEHEKRLEIFTDNKAFVEKHNAEYEEGKHSHWVGLNHLADLTSDEFKVMLGFKHSLLSARPPVDANTWEYTHVEAAKSVDWVSKGAVTPVKNQGQCGSCWAFSTTGSVEGANFLSTGKLVSVSEQELVSCSHNGNMGCNGGLMDNAFQWIVTNKGIDTESDYSYTAMTGTCDTAKEDVHAVTIDGFKDVPQNSEKDLAKAVTMQPVSVAIEADHQSFQLYKGGVYAASDCGTQLDHGVLVVGYGVDKAQKHKHFWKVKNSWGASWGEEGYIRMAKGGGAAAGQCGIAMQPSYPTKSAAVEALKEA